MLSHVNGENANCLHECCEKGNLDLIKCVAQMADVLTESLKDRQVSNIFEDKLNLFYTLE